MTPADIKQARQSLGLTQAQLALMLGYAATPRISELERGERVPSACIMRLLRAYLAGYRPDDWPAAKEAR